ncbi:MAG: nucleotidyl transferase AbiEii/AbiGii toxin family protein, partial [Rhizobiaceae bacterium]|nr:nucleotidyl transferase AbiEii/AbiGii toxin family protein [Rhizobiaceae bacterium]
YAAAVSGGLQLVPVGDGAKALKDDYARMVEDGLLFDDAEPFEALMARCADIAARANRVAR